MYRQWTLFSRPSGNSCANSRDNHLIPEIDRLDITRHSYRCNLNYYTSYYLFKRLWAFRPRRKIFTPPRPKFPANTLPAPPPPAPPARETPPPPGIFHKKSTPPRLAPRTPPSLPPSRKNKKYRNVHQVQKIMGRSCNYPAGHQFPFEFWRHSLPQNLPAVASGHRMMQHYPA